jgi:hypothetical protein
VTNRDRRLLRWCAHVWQQPPDNHLIKMAATNAVHAFAQLGANFNPVRSPRATRTARTHKHKHLTHSSSHALDAHSPVAVRAPSCIGRALMRLFSCAVPQDDAHLFGCRHRIAFTCITRVVMSFMLMLQCELLACVLGQLWWPVARCCNHCGQGVACGRQVLPAVVRCDHLLRASCEIAAACRTPCTADKTIQRTPNLAPQPPWCRAPKMNPQTCK